eukprot:3316379-Amphidinium_carterae.2
MAVSENTALARGQHLPSVRSGRHLRDVPKPCWANRKIVLAAVQGRGGWGSSLYGPPFTFPRWLPQAAGASFALIYRSVYRGIRQVAQPARLSRVSLRPGFYWMVVQVAWG